MSNYLMPMDKPYRKISKKWWDDRHNSRINDVDREKMRVLRMKGYTMAEIAAEVGVVKSTVSKIFKAEGDPNPSGKGPRRPKPII